MKKIHDTLRPSRVLRRAVSDAYDKGGTSPRFVLMGMVVDNVDPKRSKRLRVRCIPTDDNLEDSELPLARPFLPIHFGMTPKKDEMVHILVANPWFPYRDRYWVGPITGDGEFGEQPFDDAYDSHMDEHVEPSRGYRLVVNPEDRQSGG